MIITRTPLRISFFGGGTDFPEWFVENGGCVLGTAIKQYCYTMLDEKGKVFQCSDLPDKSGLGSSSAYTVGLLKAINPDYDCTRLARVTIDWERQRTGGKVGYQDQYLCALGGMLRLDFTEHAVFTRTIFAEGLEDSLMLFLTHNRRANGFQNINEQIGGMTRNYSVLRDIQALVEAGERCVSNPSEFGKLLHEEWALKKRLGDHITTPEIDAIYETARKAGAIGGKLLGAGGGGFMLLSVEHDYQAAVKKALGGFLYAPVRFAEKGTCVIFSDSAKSVGMRDSDC